MTVAALLLAAGTASRYRAVDPSLPTKLVALLDGVPLVRRVAEVALTSRASPVVVVTGHAEVEVRAALGELPVRIVQNPDYATGMASSLRAGLAALPAEASGALVLLGDMPALSASLLDRLIMAFDAESTLEAVVPVHDGQRGNPVLLGRLLFSLAMALDGDEGARRLLTRAREVPVDEAATLIDIDDPVALQVAARAIAARPIGPVWASGRDTTDELP